MLKLKDIEFSYGNSFSLSDINLAVKEKDFIVVLGPNGSGKSTLLKIMSGYLTPSKGDVSLASRKLSDFSKKEIAKIISYVPQFTYSIFPYSVYEIVMMGRTPYLNFAGYEHQNDIDIVYETLERLGLIHLANKGINEISGGEAQRAFIARALVQKAKIMLLDEPNAHLDLQHQLEIFRLLRELNIEENLTIVTVSHDLNLPAYFAEKILLLHNGKVFHFGDKKEVLTEKNIEKVFKVKTKIVFDGERSLINLIPDNEPTDEKENR